MRTVIIIEADGKIYVEIDRPDVPVEVCAKQPVSTVPVISPALPKDAPKVSITPEDRKAAYAKTPPPARYKEKPCIICAEPYTPKRIDQVLCGKPECKKEYQRRAAKHHQQNNRGKGIKPSEASKAWAGKSFDRKPPIVTPPPAQKTEDEDEAKAVTKAMDKQRADFKDPWNCAMCRNAGDLCRMHESMEADGKRPPLNPSYSRPEGTTI